jgi:hypothetical protein
MLTSFVSIRVQVVGAPTENLLSSVTLCNKLQINIISVIPYMNFLFHAVVSGRAFYYIYYFYIRNGHALD